MKISLQDNNIELYSIHNEGKSIAPERTKKLKNKICDFNIKKCIYW